MIAILAYVLYSLGSWLMGISSMSCDFRADKYRESSVCYSILLNPIRPGGGGSEAQMTKLTAANQKPLTL